MIDNNFPVEDILPSDVLDEIVVSDQSHVLGYFENNDYSEEDVANFVSECRSFDMIRSCNLYTNSMSRKKILTRMYNDIKEYPTEYKRFDLLNKLEKAEYISKGIHLLSEGKVALFLLAGGQASRLSPETIKGDFDFGLPSHKSLFQRLMQSVHHMQNDVMFRTSKSVQIPIYIMTSEFNYQTIEDIFEQNDYYGLQKNQITFFSQGSLPCVDQNGHFVMRKKHQISLSPNGSGGLFFALQKHRILQTLKEKGIEYMHCFGIDNAAEFPADPLFLGYAASQHSEICIKCVEKCCPEEQLSMIVEYGNKPLLAIWRDSEGDLVYRYGFIFDTILTVDFLVNHCLEVSLPAYCHIVKKAIPYFDPILNRTVTPINPNAYKLEYYFSDIFPLASAIAVAVVSRREYIPIINPSGHPIATPEKAVEALSESHLAYLEECEIACCPSNEKTPCLIEISPLVSIRDEGLDKLKEIQLSLPCSVYDRSEVELTTENHRMLTDTVAILNEKENTRFVYVV